MTPPTKVKDQVATDIASKTTSRRTATNRPASGTGNAAGGALATGVNGQYERPESYDPSADFPFQRLMPSLRDFRLAVSEAIAQDRREFNMLIAASSVVAPLTGPVLQIVRMRHESHVTQAEMARARFERAAMKLGEFATLPPRLQAQARRWDGLAGRLTERANQAREWAAVPGWSGDSANEYQAAALTQANAIAELAGIFASAGKSAMSAAALNMAAFSNVARATVMYTGLVRTAPSLTRSFQFIRTQVAKQRADELSEVLEQLVNLNRTRAGGLTAQIGVTVGSPALLKPGSWPSGTQGASVAPVDTSRSIRPDLFYAYIT